MGRWGHFKKNKGEKTLKNRYKGPYNLDIAYGPDPRLYIAQGHCLHLPPCQRLLQMSDKKRRRKKTSLACYQHKHRQKQRPSFVLLSIHLSMQVQVQWGQRIEQKQSRSEQSKSKADQSTEQSRADQNRAKQIKAKAKQSRAEENRLSPGFSSDYLLSVLRKYH
jgi:hypothetical protein